MCPFNFSKNTYDTSQVFYARLSGDISGKKQLLEALYYLLGFPVYFGFNWDALFDVMIDFHWIHEKKIVLVHDSFPNLPEDELKTYLEILRDAILMLRKQESGHQLEVVFREKNKKKIFQILEVK